MKLKISEIKFNIEIGIDSILLEKWICELEKKKKVQKNLSNFMKF